MYESEVGAKRPVRRTIHQYEIAATSINELMPVVLAEVHKAPILRHKLFSTAFHVTIGGEAMVTLVYHKALAKVQAEWEKAAGVLRYGDSYCGCC
jgi:tRNA (uracil-5-)-methyltransferase